MGNQTPGHERLCRCRVFRYGGSRGTRPARIRRRCPPSRRLVRSRHQGYRHQSGRYPPGVDRQRRQAGAHRDVRSGHASRGRGDGIAGRNLVACSCYWADDATLLARVDVHAFDDPQAATSASGSAGSQVGAGATAHVARERRSNLSGSRLPWCARSARRARFHVVEGLTRGTEASAQRRAVKRGRRIPAYQYNLYEVDLKSGNGKTSGKRHVHSRRTGSSTRRASTWCAPTGIRRCETLQRAGQGRRRLAALYEAGRCGHLSSHGTRPTTIRRCWRSTNNVRASRSKALVDAARRHAR